MTLTKEDVFKLVKEKDVKMVDFKIIDLPGRWHHISIPVSQFGPQTFTEGIGIDASSYPGYKKVEAGDVKIIPDPKTAMIDPFCEPTTLSLMCDIFETDMTGYSRYPRSIAKRAMEYLAGLKKGIGLFSPELEFYIFDDVKYGSHPNWSYYCLDSKEAFWNTSKEESPNLGYKFPQKGGYHGIPPADTLNNIRARMVQLIEEAGIPVKYHHHEVGGPGQVEIEVTFGDLMFMADAVMIMKYIIKNVACENQKTVTFMPKPLYKEAGNGMHVHQYLSDAKKSLFYDKNGYGGLNKLGLNYIAGLLAHGPALLAFTNPSTNSYKRLVPGYEAPVNLFFSLANRSAAVRIPAYDVNPVSERVEFRPSDATCNPYLALSAMLMAGLDGIQKDMDPGAMGFGPFDVDIEKAPPELKEKIKLLPCSMEESLEALRQDKEFLLKGGVFTEDLIDTWIDYKLKKEAAEIKDKPHPVEFQLYYDF